MFVNHPEHLEETLSVSVSDAHSSVFDSELEHTVLVLVAASLPHFAHCDSDSACSSELVRIRDQVHEDLFESAWIRVKVVASQSSLALNLKPDAFLFALDTEDELDVVKNLVKSEVGVAQSEQTCLHFG